MLVPTFNHEIVGMDEPVSNPTCQFTQSLTSPHRTCALPCNTTPPTSLQTRGEATHPVPRRLRRPDRPPHFEHDANPPTVRHVKRGSLPSILCPTTATT